MDRIRTFTKNHSASNYITQLIQLRYEEIETYKKAIKYAPIVKGIITNMCKYLLEQLEGTEEQRENVMKYIGCDELNLMTKLVKDFESDDLSEEEANIEFVKKFANALLEDVEKIKL